MLINNNVLISVEDSDILADGTLVIPEGVKIVKESCFCSSPILKKLIFPSTLTAIKRSAFRYCMSLEEVIFANTKGLRIMECAFNTCLSLKSVTFADGLKEIGASAFGNTALKRVVLPNTVTAIGEEAFSRCWDLESCTIPKGASVGNFAFIGSPIKDFYIGGENSFQKCSLYAASGEKCFIHTPNGKYCMFSAPANSIEDSNIRTSRVLIIEDEMEESGHKLLFAFCFKGNFVRDIDDDFFELEENSSGKVTALHLAS